LLNIIQRIQYSYLHFSWRLLTQFVVTYFHSILDGLKFISTFCFVYVIYVFCLLRSNVSLYLRCLGHFNTELFLPTPQTSVMTMSYLYSFLYIFLAVFSYTDVKYFNIPPSSNIKFSSCLSFFHIAIPRFIVSLKIVLHRTLPTSFDKHFAD